MLQKHVAATAATFSPEKIKLYLYVCVFFFPGGGGVAF